MRMSTIAKASFRRLVIISSAAEGSGASLGWLWARMIAAALWPRAALTISRGWTLAPSMVQPAKPDPTGSLGARAAQEPPLFSGADA